MTEELVKAAAALGYESSEPAWAVKVKILDKLRKQLESADLTGIPVEIMNKALSSFSLIA
jgi:hypothetical protein